MIDKIRPKYVKDRTYIFCEIGTELKRMKYNQLSN